MSTLQIPPVGVPFLDTSRNVTEPWRKFLSGLLERTGGYEGDVIAGLAGMGSTTGLVAQTGASDFAKRTLTAGAGVTVTNGTGASGNPTVAITDTAVAAGTYASPTSITVNSRGQITAIS